MSCRQNVGGHDDHVEFHELRWLHSNWSEIEPCVGPIHHCTTQGHNSVEEEHDTRQKPKPPAFIPCAVRKFVGEETCD